MAVTFNPIGGSSITIGGTSGTGPFPKYSINTERVESGDGTLIDLIYNISVTGQIIAEGNITTPGMEVLRMTSRLMMLFLLALNMRIRMTLVLCNTKTIPLPLVLIKETVQK